MTDAEAREVVSDLLVRAGFDLFSDTIDQLTDAIVQLWKARGGTAEETLRELTQTVIDAHKDAASKQALKVLNPDLDIWAEVVWKTQPPANPFSGRVDMHEDDC